MDDIITIAQSTFYRVARLKAFYVILVICVLDVAAMGAYKELSLGMERQLMIDCGLAIMLVVGLITSMVAAFEIPRELREKTAQFILSKPMGRNAFIWGKFLGVGGLALFAVIFVAIGSLLAYRLSFGETPWHMVHGAILIGVEAIVLTAVGLLLSIFLSDTLAAIGLFAAFVLGHSLFVLPRFSENILFQAIYYIHPNLYNLDVKTPVSHGLEIPLSFVGWGVVYGVAYSLFVTTLAIILFNRKDIS